MSDAGMMTVLVTGATGLTGSHSVKALLAKGHRVVAFVRTPEKARRVFGEETEKLTFAQGDITDEKSVRSALEGCDAVIHAAAVVAVEGIDRDELIETNVSGVKNVIGGAISAGIERIVYVSSLSAIYRDDGSHVDADTEPLDSVHAYGHSKVLCERYVRELQDAGSPVKTIFPCAILGPDDPGLTESMGALRIFAGTLVLTTTSGFQFVDARDLADAHLRMLESPPAPGRYIAGGHFLGWFDLAERLGRLKGTRVRRVPFPPRLLLGLGALLDVVRKIVPVGFPLTAESAAYITAWHAAPTTDALLDLGVRFRDPDETLGDSVAWLREAGHL